MNKMSESRTVGKMSQLMFWNKSNHHHHHNHHNHHNQHHNNNNNSNNSSHNNNSTNNSINGSNNNNNNNGNGNDSNQLNGNNNINTYNNNNNSNNNNNHGSHMNAKDMMMNIDGGGIGCRETSNRNSSSTNKEDNNNNNSNNKHGKRNWLHSPEALLNGHVVYLVKFFGHLAVDQPKGIEVVKDTIRKLQFGQQMKKAETGTQEKFKKVEITISVDGVAVQEPRTQKILHQFPLHNISYCADEKGVKKFFSFIAKNNVGKQQTNNNSGEGEAEGVMVTTTNGQTTNTTTSTSTHNEESHECYVFISNKLASDITLTIGQAFELAFRKYINSTEKTELGKAQQQIQELERIVNVYKSRLRELSSKLSKSELDVLLQQMGIRDILELPTATTTTTTTAVGTNKGKPAMNGESETQLLIDTTSSGPTATTTTTNDLNMDATSITTTTNNNNNNNKSMSFLPTVPPRNSNHHPLTMNNNNHNHHHNHHQTQKMDELLLNSDSDSDFDPRADENNVGHQDIGTLDGGGSSGSNHLLFGFEPQKTATSFGQQLFNNGESRTHNNNNNNNNSNTNSFLEKTTVTPPLLAPPPKSVASRRTTGGTQLTNGKSSLGNGNNPPLTLTDPFGLDPFEMGVIEAGSIFQKAPPPPLSKISVDDFTLESLDPLRK